MSGGGVLASAADLIDGRPLDQRSETAGRALLDGLNALSPDNLEARRDLSRLLRVADRLDRVFRLRAPDMPGLQVFGAEADPAAFGARWGTVRGASGVGTTPLDAFRRCIGEAVEHLSQHVCAETTFGAGAAGGGAMPPALRQRLLALADRMPPDDPAGWHDARLAGSDARVSVPVDFCWRRHPDERLCTPKYAPGLGCAAGRSGDAATLSAVLEVVERDAMALWWRGGALGRPVAAEVLAASGVLDTLRRARGAAAGRQSWFLDITSDVGVPVAVAISFDRDGANFAFGLAAAPTLAWALAPASRELGQMELADHVVQAKIAERGENGLNDVDRMHLRRTRAISADWPILHPAGAAAAYDDAAPSDERGRVAYVLDRLRARGHEVILVDQTQPKFAIPVMRALVPTLQPEPSTIETPRLRQMRARTGAATAPPRPAIM